MEYVTPEEMSAAEKEAVANGTSVATLMENAGRAVASVVDERYGSKGSRRLLVVCGTGNNGGDGFVVARYLKRDWSVLVLLLGTPYGIRTEEAKKNWERVQELVVPVTDVEGLRAHRKFFDRADVIVAAITGTGVRGGLREPAATAVEMINASRAAKVAVDVPSGLDPLTGEVSGAVVRADLTVALHRPKVGTRGKDEYTGEVVVVQIGIGG